MEVQEWAQNTTNADGSRVIDREWVQLNLARVHAGPSSPPDQLEGRLDPPRAASTWPARRSSRPSAPSSTWSVPPADGILGPSAYLERRSVGSVLGTAWRATPPQPADPPSAAAPTRSNGT